MAELAAIIGTAALGWVVEQLLSKVLQAFQRLKDGSSNVRKLRDLLERLEPSVKVLSSVPNADHPAGKWLTELRAQLEVAHDLAKTSGRIAHVVSACGRILKLYRTSKKALEVCNCIRGLLAEAATLQWASQLAFNRILAENDDKMLDEFEAVRERDEQLFRDIANLATKDDILRGLSRIEQTLSSPSLDIDGSSASNASAGTRFGESSYNGPEVKVTFGGDATANKLRTYLLEGDYSKWVGLWGMGGIGKTFTARRIYDHPEIRQSYSDGVHWVTVSKEQAGPYHLCKILIETVRTSKSASQVPQDLDSASLPPDLESAKSYLRKLLEKKRVLLILDDVWDDDDGDDVLQHFDLVSENEKSVILVTTRDKRVLECGRLCQLFEVPILSEEDSWRLFCWHAFDRRGSAVPSDLKAVAEDVAKECRGLPLALEVIGSTMGDKRLSTDQRALGLSLQNIWQNSLGHLRHASLGHGKNEYKRLFRSLQVSVDSLQDSRLKDCFLYFAAYPEDYNVPADDIINIWVADGLVEDELSGPFSGQVEGKLILSCLVAKSMLQMEVFDMQVDFEQKITCRVHDVMRDVAQHNLKANAVTGEEIPANARDCLYASGLKLSTLPKEWTRSGSKVKAKRLSMMRNDLLTFPQTERFCADDLHMLMLSGNHSLQSLSETFFRRLSNLRMLDLSFTGIRSIPDGVLRELSSLVRLDLTKCDNLEKISDEVSSLEHLEFLMLEGCQKLAKLPRVSQLKNLRCFSAYVPSGSGKERRREDDDGKLQALQNERPMRAQDGDDHQLSQDDNEFACVLARNDDAENAAQQEGAQQESQIVLPFEFPTSLRELHLEASESCPGKYSFDISCLPALEKLGLNRLWSFPPGMDSLRHLEYLKVIMNPDMRVSGFSRLDKLEHFNTFLFSPRNLEGLQSYFDSEAFPRLRYLRLECGKMEVAKMFIFRPSVMPNLEYLCIVIRNKTQLPTSIIELQSLKRLRLVFLYILPLGDLELLFTQQLCLPRLEYLFITVFGPFDEERIRENLPTHVLERERMGKLSLVIPTP